MKILFIPTWYPSKDNPVAGIFIKEHAKAASLYNDVRVFFAQETFSLNNNRFIDSKKTIEEGIVTYRIRYKNLFSCFKRVLSKTPLLWRLNFLFGKFSGKLIPVFMNTGIF